MPPSAPKKQSSKLSDNSKDISLTKTKTSRQDLMVGNLGPAGAAGDTDWYRPKTFLKPEDQLQLSEADLQEEIARVLMVHNTRIPDSLVEWSWKWREFVRLPDPPHLVTLLNISGTMLLKESEEARVQMAGGVISEFPICFFFAEMKAPNSIYTLHIVAEADDDPHADKEKGDGLTDELDEQEDEDDDTLIGDEDDDDAREADVSADKKKTDGPTEAEGELDEDEAEVARPKKVPNQFNFCERAALTYDNPMRDVTTQTVPPPTASFNGHVFQWIIFDEYQEDFLQQQKEKEKERKVAPMTTQPKKEDAKRKVQSEAMAGTFRMLQAAKTLERMVNQNIFDDISQDYRYWNDPSDEFKDGEGSLLPLWRFSYEKTKKHDVTDMCFNSRYYDFFAVSFGSMSFESTVASGTVCLFSLKNPSYPEWICPIESPVMCLDFSMQHPHLLVIGTMDGTVAVYNVMLPPTAPQYKSNDVVQKHGGIVWEVRWAPDTEEGNLAFYSVSIDGKINHWVLNQNDLGVTTVMTLYLDRDPIPGPDGTMITLKGCGTCIAFHPTDKNIFLVGTEEGTIYKCNTAYSSVYMKTYKEAHNMPVYRIVFNKYNSSIFASCSGDWRIKIWEDDRLEPLFMFDLGVPIGDVQWAPYSSTVLACVSNDGKVTVFDLNVNKYRPICSQAIVSKKRSKLTRLAFNQVLPFLVVGDDKGVVNTLKLSPNLRVRVKPTKKQLHLSQAELESLKLERLLSFVREPPVLTPPKDVAVTH
ncbi:dynein intermediate chain 2, ciliary [Cephus cinctus]|uniref:Dynein intermediate chain 2, ciliary n=1 Tax=Cephus cinctus TaxID=211228 RepID=A0AAJ7BXS6_CEPCN|nr:dynein intermediate chain 2, ciliary [Cephus cinctus]